MPYDDGTAQILRDAVSALKFETSDVVSERNMFGGLCVLLNGNMLAGVVGSQVVVRLADHELEEALELPYVRPMDFTGKPMKNFAYLNPAGFVTINELNGWLEKSLVFVRDRQRVPTKKTRPSLKKIDQSSISRQKCCIP